MLKENAILEVKKREKKKIWKKYENPVRSIVLFGWDSCKNPSLLILYGQQQYKNNSENEMEYILKDLITYTHYVLLRGKNGHCPAFPSITIDTPYYYNKRDKDDIIQLCSATNEERYEFYKLEKKDELIFSYFEELSYLDYKKEIEERKISFSNFELASSPNEILQLEQDLEQYCNLIREIISNENLYLRRKYLNQLFACTSDQRVYKHLLKIASTELISGLFLQFAKRNKKEFIQDAKEILKLFEAKKMDNYEKGVMRCIQIYLNCMDKEEMKKREKWIRSTLDNLEFRLTNIRGKKIKKEMQLEGHHYRKYALQGLLEAKEWVYDPEKKKGEYVFVQKRYEEGAYTDGRILNKMVLKQTIQEAESYGLADVLGKIAYYFDSPGLHYYLQGNHETKFGNYFRKYIRRILDTYAKEDEEKFVQAMKVLFTNYKEGDYLCKYLGNFQFNLYLKHYLYYYFQGKKPELYYSNWREAYEWMSQDQLMKLQGRYEMGQDIWNRHLTEVVEIAANAKINSVRKAFYYIIKDPNNLIQIIEQVTMEQLIALVNSPYEPLSDLFIGVLTNWIKDKQEFDPEFMLSLMKETNEIVRKLVIHYFNRTNGSFMPDKLVSCLNLSNFELWFPIFRQTLYGYSLENYTLFIRELLQQSQNLKEEVIESENVINCLNDSIQKIHNITKEERGYFVSSLIQALSEVTKISNKVVSWIQQLLFGFSYEQLEEVLEQMECDFHKAKITQEVSQIYAILEGIQTKQLCTDAQIVQLLKFGNSRMIQLFIKIVEYAATELQTRYSTILLLLECDIIILNELAKESVEQIKDQKDKAYKVYNESLQSFTQEEEQLKNNYEHTLQNFHKVLGYLLDSPIEKVYGYGLEQLEMEYHLFVPKPFIIQLLEHPSSKVKAYISSKISYIFNHHKCDLEYFEEKHQQLFLYYVKTLLYLPNKISKSKRIIYHAIPKFVNQYKENRKELEEILLDIGSSNQKIDSERALVALVQMKKEASEN